jgi:hypothetical protein
MERESSTGFYLVVAQCGTTGRNTETFNNRRMLICKEWSVTERKRHKNGKRKKKEYSERNLVICRKFRNIWGRFYSRFICSISQNSHNIQLTENSVITIIYFAVTPCRPIEVHRGFGGTYCLCLSLHLYFLFNPENGGRKVLRSIVEEPGIRSHALEDINFIFTAVRTTNPKFITVILLTVRKTLLRYIEFVTVCRCSEVRGWGLAASAAIWKEQTQNQSISPPMRTL